MKKLRRVFSKLYIAGFFAIIALPWVIWGLLALFDKEAFEKFSNISDENRNRNTFEIYSLYESGQELSDYIDDRVPFRKYVIDTYQRWQGKADAVYRNASNGIMNFFGKSSNEVQVVDTPYEDMFSENGEPVVSLDAQPVTPYYEYENVDHDHECTVALEQVEPECEKEGYIRFICDLCGEEVTKVVPAKGHSDLVLKETYASYTEHGYKLCKCTECEKIYLKDYSPKLVDTNYMAPQIVNGSTILGRSWWLFFAGDDSESYYKGTNLLSDETLQSYADKVNRLKELCDARGISLYMIFYPNKEQVYSEYMPTYEIVDEYKRTQRLVDYLNENTSVPSVYPLNELKTADIYWPSYCMYDTHWNHFGAFYGMQALYKVMGMELTNPIYETIYQTANDRNDLLTLAGLSRENYPEDPDYVVNYKPEIENDDFEVIAPVSRVNSKSSNQQRLVFISDSFREAMANYIVKDFSYTTLAHGDYINDISEDILNGNVLVMGCVERYDYRMFNYIDKVISILESN